MLETPLSHSNNLTPCDVLAERLEPLLGEKLQLSGKSRTDGSNLRKTVIRQLERYGYELNDVNNCTCAKKGVPKIKSELIDTYIVTTGTSYNLQVWNRIPTSNDPLIEYDDGSALCCADVRYTLIRVEPTTGEIRSIIMMSPAEIERRFGRFGVPTIKWQLIISDTARQRILKCEPPMLIGHDCINDALLTEIVSNAGERFDNRPKPGNILTIRKISEIVMRELLGVKIETAATKNRGQDLELRIMRMLGYSVADNEKLAGGYPDLPNQALEIKVQDSPTVDLGKYSPQYEVEIYPDLGISTANMRYLIALMDKRTDKVAGIVLCSGHELGKYFSYVADKSYKCQRSIPMSFFDEYDGQSVFLG